jgi:hypothetical protein
VGCQTIEQGERGSVDGGDIATIKICVCQCLAGDIDKKRLGAFEKRLGAFRPAARLQIPVERLDGVTLDNAVLEKMLENRSNSGKRVPNPSQAAARTSFCKNTFGGTDVARETRAAVGIARTLLPLAPR